MMGSTTYTFDFSNIISVLENNIYGTEDDAKTLLKTLLQHDIIYDSDYPDEYMSNPLVPDSGPIYGAPDSHGYDSIIKQFTSSGYYRNIYNAYNAVSNALDTILEENRNTVITIVFDHSYTYIIIGSSVKEYRYDEAVDAHDLQELLREDSL